MGSNPQNIGNFYPPQNPVSEYPNYPNANPYYPPGNPYGVPQYPIQEHEAPNPLTAMINSPNIQRKGNSDLPAPYPQPEEKDWEAKQKRINAHVSLQNDLLRQMEEKKMRKAQEEAKKKMEDELEELRIRRENEMIRQRDQQEAQKKRQVFENFQQENHKLATNVIQNSGVAVMEPKKGKAKRARTPIEEVIERTMGTNTNTITEQTLIQEAPLEDFQHEVGKQIQSSIENQLSGLKREWEHQQISLHHQLLDLKVK